MGRRAKSSKGKAEPKRSPVRKPPENEPALVRDLEKRLAESLEREKSKDRALTEALEQQTATAEILRIISSRPRTSSLSLRRWRRALPACASRLTPPSFAGTATGFS